ncbi:MAG: alkaline phosphatase family protein [Armatimonadota bacterium]
MSDGPLVMIMLDSLSHAYVMRGDAPYFASRIPEGCYCHLESLFAFEGIMASVLTGCWPDETGVFARFCYDPAHSVMRRNPLRLLNVVNRHAYYADGERRDGRQNCLIVKAVRRLLRKYWYTGGFNNLSPYGRVPLALADRFRYSMVLGAYDQTLEIAGHETLFGLVRRQGRQGLFHYGELPGARERLSGISNLKEYALIFIHTWSQLDTEGHRLGPDSPDLRAMVRQCDEELADFLPWLECQLGPEASFILFADHGMHRVERWLDVSEVVERAIGGEGPLVFIDSTAVRGWGSERELEALGEQLRCLPSVRVLDKTDLKLRRAYFPDGRYGALIAVAEPGAVFVPDYFNGSQRLKGMHGYFRDTEWLRPGLLYYGPGFSGSAARLQPEGIPDIWRLAATVLNGREAA